MTRSANQAQQSVCIIQRRLTHYRVPLFVALRTALSERGIHLRLLVGRGMPDEETKNDAGELTWAEPIPTLSGGRAAVLATRSPACRGR